MLWPQQVASFQEKDLLAKRTSDKKRDMHYDKASDKKRYRYYEKARKRACKIIKLGKSSEEKKPPLYESLNKKV